MKKITLSLFLLFAMIYSSFGQVAVGEGTSTTQFLPLNAYYGYSYSQSIYLASEINASGSITSIQWYYSGNSAMTNSQGLTVYLGQTTKSNFASETDYISISEMTAVYTGGLPTQSTPGWKSITLATPFLYDGISNLVVAVDENMASYDTDSDRFYNSDVNSNRSIYAYADNVNPDPANPTAGVVTREMTSFVPNIIFGGITQSCSTPFAITATQATTNQVLIGWNAAAGQTNWEVYVVQQNEPAPTPQTAGTAVAANDLFVKTDLIADTGYSIYVRAICSETLFSSWTAPKKFRTLCESFDALSENFDTLEVGEEIIPNCWTKTIASTSNNTQISVTIDSPASSPNAIYMNNAEDPLATMLLVTPALSAIGSNEYRLKFKARGVTNGQVLIMGTMSDPTDPSTFVQLQSAALTPFYAVYKLNLNTSTTADHIAFKHGLGGSYRSIYIDDVVWELIPTAIPGCIVDMNAVTNAECGNFATTFTWAAVQGADGYKVSIGTSANGQDLVVDNVNITSSLTISFIGNPATTYFYTVKPYNSIGEAVGCFEDTFTTASDGCYCVSVPPAIAELGATTIQINGDDFQTQVVTYADFTEEDTVEMYRGVQNTVNINFAPDYGYYAYIWIDYNDNYVFESSELVYSGISEGTNEVLLNAAFLTNAAANLGIHRMRIGSAAFAQNPPNPCYNGYGGLTMDFLVNVLEAPVCIPPTTTSVTNIQETSAQINWVSNNTLFNIEYADEPFVVGNGILMTGLEGNQTTLSDLASQTDYTYYLQTDCGTDGLSPWIGPFTFRTACPSFIEFQENFTTDVNLNAPECWYTLKNSSSQFSNVFMEADSDNVEMYTANDANATLYLITPNLIALPQGINRARFIANAYTPVSIIVGTMTNPDVASSFTAVQTILLTTSPEEYTVIFNTITTDLHVAIKFIGTGVYQSVYIDNFSWEAIPTAIPSCAANVNAVTNSLCGNYPTVISWPSVSGADFYNLKIGTATGEGTTTNIGNVNSYSFIGEPGTMYYYTLVPGNIFGLALNCVENSFATYAEGCYCESIPDADNLDGNGISSVVVGSSSFTVPAQTYTDLTAQNPAMLSQGLESVNTITFETGYPYDTHIWIDWDDNFIFDTDEKVFTGASTGSIPSVLSASFLVPADAPIGVHRMRIGAADSGQQMPDPCFSGFYGVTVDLNVEVTSLDTEDFIKNTFTAFPNPVKNILNISNAQNISSVEVYNMIGQLIITKSSTNGQVDMSSLNSGTYLVKINTDSGVKTVKVIKE